MGGKLEPWRAKTCVWYIPVAETGDGVSRYPRMYCYVCGLMGEEAHVHVYGMQCYQDRKVCPRKVCHRAEELVVGFLPVRSIHRSLCGGDEVLCGGWVNRICWSYWIKWPSRVDFKDRCRQGSREEKIGERRMMCGWVGLIGADLRGQAVVQHW